MRVPENIGVGKAQVVAEFAAWKEAAVASTKSELVVAYSRQRDLKLEPVSARLRARLPHANPGSGLESVRFSPDGKRILAADYPGGVVQVWDALTRKQLTRIETGYGYRGDTYYVFLSPDWKTMYVSPNEPKSRSFELIEKEGKRLMRWTFRGKIHAWDLSTGEIKATFKHTPERQVVTMAVSPDASFIVSAERLPGEVERDVPTAISIWETRTGRVRSLPDGLGLGATFAPDSRSFAMARRDNLGYTTAIEVLDVALLKTKLSIPVAERWTRAYPSAFSPDGKVLIGRAQTFPARGVFNDSQSSLKFWDASTGRELASDPAPHKNAHFLAYLAKFSRDGRIAGIVYTYGDPFQSQVRLYEVHTGKLLRTIDRPGEMLGIPAFSPDDKWLAVPSSAPRKRGTSDEFSVLDEPQPRIHLIEAATGRIVETFITPQGLVGSACFSPDGKTLATTGYGEVLLWDMTRPPGAGSAK